MNKVNILGNVEIETFEGGKDIKELTVVEDAEVAGVCGNGLVGGVVTLGCGLDLRKQRIHNIRAGSKLRVCNLLHSMGFPKCH